MKRIILFFFILIAVALPMLPGARPLASQSGGNNISEDHVPPELARITKRRMHPHDYIVNTAERVEEISRTTRDVAATLPRIDRLEQRTKGLAESYDNIIDKEIFGTLAERGIEPAGQATDEELCRRI